MLYTVLLILMCNLADEWERLWLNGDMSVCQIDKGSIVLDSFYVNLTEAKDIWEKRVLFEKRLPEDQPLGKPIGHFLNKWLKWEEKDFNLKLKVLKLLKKNIAVTIQDIVINNKLLNGTLVAQEIVIEIGISNDMKLKPVQVKKLHSTDILQNGRKSLPSIL